MRRPYKNHHPHSTDVPSWMQSSSPNPDDDSESVLDLDGFSDALTQGSRSKGSSSTKESISKDLKSVTSMGMSMSSEDDKDFHTSGVQIKGRSKKTSASSGGKNSKHSPTSQTQMGTLDKTDMGHWEELQQPPKVSLINRLIWPLLGLIGCILLGWSIVQHQAVHHVHQALEASHDMQGVVNELWAPSISGLTADNRASESTSQALVSWEIHEAKIDELSRQIQNHMQQVQQSQKWMDRQSLGRLQATLEAGKKWLSHAKTNSEDVTFLQLQKENITRMNVILKNGIEEAQKAWFNRYQETPWSGQLELNQALDGMIQTSQALSHQQWDIRASESHGSTELLLTSEHENKITQNLQALSSLNGQPSPQAQAWTSLAQTWVKVLPSLQAWNQNSEKINQSRQHLQNFLIDDTVKLSQALDSEIQAWQSVLERQSQQAVLLWSVWGIWLVLIVATGWWTNGISQSRKSMMWEQHEHLQQRLDQWLGWIQEWDWHEEHPLNTVWEQPWGDGLKALQDKGDKWRRQEESLNQSLALMFRRNLDLQDHLMQQQKAIEQVTGAWAQSAVHVLDIEESVRQMSHQTWPKEEDKLHHWSENYRHHLDQFTRQFESLLKQQEEAYKSCDGLLDHVEKIKEGLEQLHYLSARIEVLSVQTDLRAVQSQDGGPFRVVAKDLHGLADTAENLSRQLSETLEAISREQEMALHPLKNALEVMREIKQSDEQSLQTWNKWTTTMSSIYEWARQGRKQHDAQELLIQNLGEKVHEGLNLTERLEGLRHEIDQQSQDILQEWQTHWPHLILKNPPQNGKKETNKG